MPLNLDIARSHLETLIERLTGVDKALADPEGDYLISTDHAGFYARVDGDDQPVIRVFTIVADKVEKSPELLDALNEINTNLSFLRAMWVRGQVMVEGEMLALTADIPDFTQVCRRTAMATDRFGPELISRFGGQPFFENTKAPEYTLTPSVQAGYL